MFIGEQTLAFFKSLYAGLLSFVVLFMCSTEKIKPDDILGKKDTLRVTGPAAARGRRSATCCAVSLSRRA